MSDAEIYGKYAEELVRFATVLVGPDSAADVVSASVITAFGAPAWPDVRNPRAYLYRAVLNESRMTARRDARRVRYEQRAAPRDVADAAVDTSPGGVRRGCGTQPETASGRVPDLLGRPRSGFCRGAHRDLRRRGPTSSRACPQDVEGVLDA